MNGYDIWGAIVGAITSLAAVCCYVFSSSGRKTFFPMAIDLRLLYLAVGGMSGASMLHWAWLAVTPSAIDHLELMGVCRWTLLSAYFMRVAYGLHKTQLSADLWREFRDLAMARLDKFVTEKAP